MKHANPNKVSLMKKKNKKKIMFFNNQNLFKLDIGLNGLILVGSVNYWFGSVNIVKNWLNIGKDRLITLKT